MRWYIGREKRTALDLEDVMQLVAQGEGRHLEFKLSSAERREAAETLCGFLNAEGGVVLIGVRDDGTVIGQQVSKQTMHEVIEQLRLLEPHAHVESERIVVKEDLEVIALRVQGNCEGVPFTFDGRAHVRVHDKTRRMPRAAFDELMRRRELSTHRWESQVDETLTFDDLDRDEVLRLRNQGVGARRIGAETSEHVEDIVKRLGLVANGRLMRAARLLFQRSPSRSDTQCLLRCGRFRGSTISAPIVDNQQEYLNAFGMVRQGMLFLLRHLPVAGVISNRNARREDRLLIPEIALREVLHNAVMHRDYSAPSGHVSVLIFDDRVEVQSTGTLPQGVALDDLPDAPSSVRRNALIAEAFYLAGLVDRWGSGLRRAADECVAAGIAVPRFEDRRGLFVVTFEVAVVPGGAQTPAGHQVGTKPALSRHQVEVLALATSAASIAELIVPSGRSDRTKFRDQVVKPLLEAGLLAMTVPEKPRSSRQRYVTTELGTQILKRGATPGH